MQDNPFIESTWTKQDETFEVPLRPQSLGDFMGQEHIRERLDVFIQAALQRKEALGHCLFYGPPGLENDAGQYHCENDGDEPRVTSGPVIEKAGDLAGCSPILKKATSFLSMRSTASTAPIEEYLYPAMEDFTLDLTDRSGPSARSVQVKLNRFTLLAPHEGGSFSSPMRSRFELYSRLDYYHPEVLQKIICIAPRKFLEI